MREIAATSYLVVARKYGVSDNAVRKWVRFYEGKPTATDWDRGEREPRQLELLDPKHRNGSGELEAA